MEEIKNVEKIRSLYKDWCGLDLELSKPVTEQKILGALRYAKNMLIDEAELGYDIIVKALDNDRN